MSARPPTRREARDALDAIRARVFDLRYDLEESDPGRWATLERVRRIEEDVEALLARLDGRGSG